SCSMAGGELRNGIRKACALLIRDGYAFKGVASNLLTYLTDVVKMRNSRAATTANTWSGFTFMLPLFSAHFTDLLGQILHHPSLFFSLLFGQYHYTTLLLESTSERTIQDLFV
ncbi:hypothetical protein HID58_080336, partial [Brassica napus]